MPMSEIRRNYILRFVFRIVVFIISIIIYFVLPESFSIIEGFNFFKEFNVFHILWIVWIFDMIMQVIQEHVQLKFKLIKQLQHKLQM